MEKNIEYANAYSEVLEILKYIPKEDYNKIPKEKIKLFETNFNKNNQFKYNPLLTLEEQNVSKRARAIIAILFKNYWATEKQKQIIQQKAKQDIMQLEKEKQEKYNAQELFKTKPMQQQEIKQDIVEYKENILKRFIRKIKIFLKMKYGKVAKWKK